MSKINSCNFSFETYRGVPIFYTCPNCKEKTFRRYAFCYTNVQLANDVGQCTRKKACGYDYSPFAYAHDKGIKLTYKGINEPPSYIPAYLLEQSLKNYDKNTIAKYLEKEFGKEAAQQMLNDYKIGTSNKIEGGAIFWQIDRNGNARSGKIVCVDSDDGNRYPGSDRFHKMVHHYSGFSNFNYVPCYFGEHLIDRDCRKTLVVVWKEITAIIGSHLYPEYTWLSSCKLPNLSMLQSLSDRHTVFYPKAGFAKLDKFDKDY